jgi:hypothetical protein
MATIDLSDYTVTKYFAARGRTLDLHEAKRIGTHAAAAWRREHNGEGAPRVREWHPGLGGWLNVSAYPPPSGPAILERALVEVSEQANYKVPPPPDV